MGNIYFELTREFNSKGPAALLTSGQAVVHYRIAMMSKDGDWILRETPEACRHVLEALARHGARYRPCAPLDVRWLAGGWSSHFEFSDDAGRRVRCDFLSRPPRLTRSTLHRIFESAPRGEQLLVVDVESLILMKQTQRAKDYPVVGELARLLPPQKEIEYTTDPDTILELAAGFGKASARPSVKAALEGLGRDAVVVALAREIDRLQAEDRARLQKYELSSEAYLRSFQSEGVARLKLPEAHARAVRLAEELLPVAPPEVRLEERRGGDT